MPRVSALFELKPKGALPDGPGLRTRTFRRSGGNFDPEEFFAAVISGNRAAIRISVTKLASSRFLRVLDEKFTGSVRDQLSFFLASESARKIFTGLREAQSTGLLEHAKMAKRITELVEITILEGKINSVHICWTPVTSADFSAQGDLLIHALSQSRGVERPEDLILEATRWIKRFLLARTAMDVSLLVERCGRITVVDLDMKPLRKIELYADENF